MSHSVRTLKLSSLIFFEFHLFDSTFVQEIYRSAKVFNMYRDVYRRARVSLKKITGEEPNIKVDLRLTQEFHGNEYCGWRIPSGRISLDSCVVDVGLGEDISFSKSLMDRYGCTIHGLDPTPRAISYIEELANPKIILHKVGISALGGSGDFFLPNNENHVSGSLKSARHNGKKKIKVDLITISQLFRMLRTDCIDLLKLDIEGAEYDVIFDSAFPECADRIGILCLEFHHRWPEFGAGATLKAVARLRELGFKCTWCQPTSNEEFTFTRECELL